MKHYLCLGVLVRRNCRNARQKKGGGPKGPKQTTSTCHLQEVISFFLFGLNKSLLTHPPSKIVFPTQVSVQWMIKVTESAIWWPAATKSSSTSLPNVLARVHAAPNSQRSCLVPLPKWQTFSKMNRGKGGTALSHPCFIFRLRTDSICMFHQT